MNQQKLIETIRAVPISGKTYEEYVEAVADRLLAEISFPGYVRYEAKALPATLNVKYKAVGMKERGTFVSKSAIDKVYNAGAKEVAREIFEEIEKNIATLEYQCNTQRKTVKVEELKAQVNWVLHEVVPATLAELKKKYTEGGE